MAGIHNVAGTTRQGVSPDGSDGGSRGDGNDLVRRLGWVRRAVAGNVLRGHVGLRTVVLRGTNSLGNATVNAVDLEGDKDSVGLAKADNAENTNEIHDGR